MSFEQALFKAFKDKFTGTLATRVKPGGFIRFESQRSYRNERRIEWEFVGSEPMDYFHATADQVQVEMATVRLHIFHEDSTAFGTGDTPENAGSVDNIVDSVRTAYDNILLTVSGYVVTRLPRGVLSVGSAPGGAVRRIMEYTIVCDDVGTGKLFTNMMATIVLSTVAQPVFEFGLDRMECDLTPDTHMTAGKPQFTAGDAAVFGHVVLALSGTAAGTKGLITVPTTIGLEYYTGGANSEAARYYADTLIAYRVSGYSTRKHGGDARLPQLYRVDWFSDAESGSSQFYGGGLDLS